MNPRVLYLATLAGCGLMFTTGVAAWLYGSTIPVFSVSTDDVQQAFLAWCAADGRIVDATGDRYLALFTDHYKWVDAGIGLCLTAMSAAAMASMLQWRTEPNVSWLRTPEDRSTFLMTGVAALLWWFLSASLSFMTDFERRYFPTCADSMGIPLFETEMSALIVIPIALGVGWAISRVFGALPVRLDHWDADRPIRSWVVTLVFGLPLIGVVALLADSLFSSMSISAPALLAALYLLASTRAALLSSRIAFGRA